CRPLRPDALRLLDAVRARGVLRPSVAAVRFRMRLRDRLPGLEAAERGLVDELFALLPE
ncbi:MAG: hypothetical protein FJ104_11385, partial [Deltaproteobacteria bacterium]|nr:hypothetical protein [Deltaproteobacteria bacterium]